MAELEDGALLAARAREPHPGRRGRGREPAPVGWSRAGGAAAGGGAQVRVVMLVDRVDPAAPSAMSARPLGLPSSAVPAELRTGCVRRGSLRSGRRAERAEQIRHRLQLLVQQEHRIAGFGPAEGDADRGLQITGQMEPYAGTLAGEAVGDQA